MSAETLEHIKVIEIRDERAMEMCKPAILLALQEIGARSGNHHPPERVYEYIRDRWLPSPDFGMYVALDTRKQGAEAVCGVSTVQLGFVELGVPVAYIGRGWVRRGYNAAPFDAWMPYLIAWAKERKCVSLVSTTDRGGLATSNQRFDIRNVKQRLTALAAYWRWIGKRGFVMRETAFELKIS